MNELQEYLSLRETLEDVSVELAYLDSEEGMRDLTTSERVGRRVLAEKSRNDAAWCMAELVAATKPVPRSLLEEVAGFRALLNFDYTDAHRNVSFRCVLVHTVSESFITAWDRDKGDWRNFNIARMRDVDRGRILERSERREAWARAMWGKRIPGVVIAANPPPKDGRDGYWTHCFVFTPHKDGITR